MKKFCVFFFSLFKKYEKRKVLQLFLVTSLPQGPQTSRKGISPGIKCKVWRKGMRNYKVMSLWRRKNLWYIKKTGMKKYKITRLRTLIELVAKSCLGCFFFIFGRTFSGKWEKGNYICEKRETWRSRKRWPLCEEMNGRLFVQ